MLENITTKVTILMTLKDQCAKTAYSYLYVSILS